MQSARLRESVEENPNVGDVRRPLSRAIEVARLGDVTGLTLEAERHVDIFDPAADRPQRNSRAGSGPTQ